jgi:hypothetical protein
MGQYKSKDRDFKSYVNAVFKCSCCCLSASLSTKTLREIKGNVGQCKSEGKDSNRDYAKENMGQSKSKERDFKEQKRKNLEVRF